MRTLKLIYKIHCSLYEPITVNDKIHSTNLLLKFKYCIWRLMVLKEVTIDFMTLYICVSIVRKSLNSLFTSFCKVKTLYWVSTDPGQDSVLLAAWRDMGQSSTDNMCF